jgi:nicotinamide mononucleotide (NMN) deamidase PncC
MKVSGRVFVAVSTNHGVYTRQVDTGSNDREQNMVAFAIEALKLLKEILLE